MQAADLPSPESVQTCAQDIYDVSSACDDVSNDLRDLERARYVQEF